MADYRERIVRPLALLPAFKKKLAHWTPQGYPVRQHKGKKRLGAFNLGIMLSCVVYGS